MAEDRLSGDAHWRAVRLLVAFATHRQMVAKACIGQLGFDNDRIDGTPRGDGESFRVGVIFPQRISISLLYLFLEIVATTDLHDG